MDPSNRSRTFFLMLAAGLMVPVLGCGGAEPPPTLPEPSMPSPPASSPPPAPAAPQVKNEDFLYLEEVTGDRALAFARAHDAVSEKLLTADPGFHPLEDRLLAIYGSKERIPAPHIESGSLRNFWTDSEHTRGLWRQTTFADYKKPKPTWSTILDVDALGKAENESFVYKGANCLHPLKKRCLVSLSRGGGDATIVREFDVDKRAFVPGGFTLPEAKSRVAWKDENTIYVGTDFGAGTLSPSGYPRISKEWKRGTPLAEAKTVFEGRETDTSVTCWREFDHGRKRDVCSRAIDYERTEFLLLKDGKPVHLDKPEDADVELWDDEILLRLRSEWIVGSPPAVYAKGSLLAAKLDAYLGGARKFQTLFEPTPRSSLNGWTGTKTKIFVNALTDVKNELVTFTRSPGDASTTRWKKTPVKETAAAIGVSAFDPDRTDDVWLWLEDFTVPSSLVLYDPTSGKREVLKQNPTLFDAANVDVAQHFATSKDGTKIPYFEIAKKDRKGPAPTVIDSYGGFEISLSPGYNASYGAAWVERGGVFVQANLRGGGEYGPAWHEAAMREKRQNAYDDLAAVAEDLIRRGVTTPKTLGISGGSNGGLLTSVLLTQHPELFGAVVSKVPLTDMQRFHKLLAGASWTSEFGDPDKPEDWAYLSKFSPFHNVKAGVTYPPMFFTTSTKDDRVHPGHARKMVAKLEALGHSPLYYENIEGGHGGAADIKQRAYLNALVFTFLGTRLGLPTYGAKP